MPRDTGPHEIAELVARAEQVKRNREVILRTFQPKPLTAPISQSAVVSPDSRLAAYLGVGDVVSTET